MQSHQGQPPAYAPPPPYSDRPMVHGTTTVITTAPAPAMMPAVIITPGPAVGSQPTILNCPSCQAQIVTRVESSPSVRTHLIAACLCLFIFWPCTCLPYCIGSCNNADHYCPNCNVYLGSYKF
ncbi:lipopolysaccharide-induced tumor necrosis factor-alpha factor homolog [Ostrinia nubilalis]|uniref:lipopolysaccharide-induced tumor necrosis factor-alpha factor homolog n=1 Tax=Ostrinia furnacalis TaxID=93504 RepID=UPI00103B803D|nr:lipopolysaccharide-induced tumor necrosis factor-alpha factor homolog [Ostrinia furnacalis]